MTEKEELPTMKSASLHFNPQIIGIIRLIRPINSVMSGIAVVIGEIVSLRSVARFPPFHELILGFLTAFFISAFAMIINDYYDIDIDKINEPHRPLPSGQLDPNDALTISVIFAILGILSSLLCNFQCFILASIIAILDFIYSKRLKREGLTGNIIVSFSVAATFIYGGLVVQSLNVYVLVFSTLSFLAILGRELTKGIADVFGDQIKNIKTICNIYGPKTASMLSAISYLSAVLLSGIFTLMLCLWMNFIYIILLMMCNTLFIFVSLILIKNPSINTAKKVKKIVLIPMLLALMAFISINS